MLRKSIVSIILFGLIVGAQAFGQKLRKPHPVFENPSILGVAATSTQKGVFAPFLAATCVTLPCSPGDLDTAISVTNTLAGPPGVQEVYDDFFHDLEGTVEIYLWDTYGHMLFYETGADSPGIGLSQEPGKEGFLTPGGTWRVLLSDILNAIDYQQHEIDFDHVEGVFAGYMWVVANFDGVQGTTNLTDFATFTQSLVLQPDLGTTFFDFSADAGVPIIPPPDEPEEP